MKKRKIYLVFVLSFLSTICLAQDRGFTLLLGPSVNVYTGNTEVPFVYTPESRSWQLNAQLGYNSVRQNAKRGNMLAVFASIGNSKPEMILAMLDNGAGLLGNPDLGRDFNQFLVLEGGMVLGGVIRLSAGLGQQKYGYYVNNFSANGALNYFSGTVGVSINLGIVNWDVNANYMAGKDLYQNAMRFNTGFMVKF